MNPQRPIRSHNQNENPDIVIWKYTLEIMII